MKTGKHTISSIASMKRRGEKITALTAYDFLMGKIVDECGIDIILVGDSLGNVLLGYETTISVTLDEMIHHAKATRRGVQRALLVFDMPFMTYKINIEDTLRTAARVMQECGVDALKIEGGAEMKPVIEALVRSGIPVMGHIGLTPQSVKGLGGFKVQGKDELAREKLLADAQELEHAGAFSIVLEAVPRELGKSIATATSMPVIGIGAGPACDGQILVIHDMLGFTQSPGGTTPRFVKKYADVTTLIHDAIARYCDDVHSGRFPSDDHCY